jgi:hypothetical protein
MPVLEVVLAVHCRFHVQRFFAVLDAADSAEGNVRHTDDTNSEGGAPSGDSAAVATEIAFSQNIAVAKLPFANTSAHLHNIKAGMLRGTCLWIDFPFPAFPENMGHWLEALAPVYSCLSNGSWMQAAPEAQGGLRAVIFPNLRREQVEVRSRASPLLHRCFFTKRLLLPAAMLCSLRSVPCWLPACLPTCPWLHCRA